MLQISRLTYILHSCSLPGESRMSWRCIGCLRSSWGPSRARQRPCLEWSSRGCAPRTSWRSCSATRSWSRWRRGSRHAWPADGLNTITLVKRKIKRIKEFRVNIVLINPPSSPINIIIVAHRLVIRPYLSVKIPCGVVWIWHPENGWKSLNN